MLKPSLREAVGLKKETAGVFMKISKRFKAVIVLAVFFTAAAVSVSLSMAGEKQDLQRTRMETLKRKDFAFVSAPERAVTINGSYHDSYVIEMGWNLHEDIREYPADAEVILADGSKITVYFNRNTRKFAADENVKKAVAACIDSQREKENFPKIEKPFINRISYVPVEKIPAFAEEYYDAGDILGFSALFPEIGEDGQARYYRKMYEEDKIDFFACTMAYMDLDTVTEYIDLTDRDGNIDFFAVLSGCLPPEEIMKYMEIYPASGDMERFIILLRSLSEEKQAEWLKNNKDGKYGFYRLLAGQPGSENY